MERVKELYDFMKSNYVMRARYRDIELDLHPAAFTKDLITPTEEKKEDIDYDEFIYPKQEDIEKMGL